MWDLRRTDRARLIAGLSIAALLAMGGPLGLAVGHFSHPVGGYSHHREVIAAYAAGGAWSLGYAYAYRFTSGRYEIVYLFVSRGAVAEGSAAASPQADARSSHESGTHLDGAYYSCRGYSCSVRRFDHDIPLGSFVLDPLLRSATLDVVVAGCKISFAWSDPGDLYRGSWEFGRLGDASVQQSTTSYAARYTRSAGSACGTTFTSGFGNLYHYVGGGGAAGHFD